MSGSITRRRRRRSTVLRSSPNRRLMLTVMLVAFIATLGAPTIDAVAGSTPVGAQDEAATIVTGDQYLGRRTLDGRRNDKKSRAMMASLGGGGARSGGLVAGHHADDAHAHADTGAARRRRSRPARRVATTAALRKELGGDGGGRADDGGTGSVGNRRRQNTSASRQLSKSKGYYSKGHYSRSSSRGGGGYRGRYYGNYRRDGYGYRGRGGGGRDYNPRRRYDHLISSRSSGGHFGEWGGQEGRTHTSSPKVSWRDYLDVETMIKSKIVESTCPGRDRIQGHWDWDGESDDCTLFSRARGSNPLGPRLLRLTFHDAAGSMDGFVNLDDPENDGLEAAVRVLRDLYENGILQSTGRKLRSVISRADLYSWAGIAAVRIMAGWQRTEYQKQYLPNIKVRYGRETYFPRHSDDRGPTESFPPMGAASNGDQLMRYFDDKFDFTKEEVVTLMGAHTVGGARRITSGYTGPWTEYRDKFDEGYYHNLVRPIPLADCDEGGGPETCTWMLNDDGSCREEGRCEGWEHVLVKSPRGRRFEWRHSCDEDGRGCSQLMLNVDIALAWDIDDHICKENDVFPSTRRPCEMGQIKSFPSDGRCRWGRDRILARCFKPRGNIRTNADPTNRNDSIGKVWTNAEPTNRNDWIDDFAVVFDQMMTRTVPRTIRGRTITLRELSPED